MCNDLEKRRQELRVSQDELAAALGRGFSQSRLSNGLLGRIQFSESERQLILATMERIGEFRAVVRDVVECAARINLANLCRDIRSKGAAA